MCITFSRFLVCILYVACLDVFNSTCHSVPMPCSIKRLLAYLLTVTWNLTHNQFQTLPPVWSDINFVPGVKWYDPPHLGDAKTAVYMTTALSHMHHLTCGISSLLHSVNHILFTLLLAHLILRISPHHNHHLRSHHLSLPRPFTPD